MKIWERLFITDLIKTFVVIMVVFYGFYCLIDYAAHMSNHHQQHIKPSWLQLAVYYAAEFSKRMDVLVPFGLLVSVIRVLCLLNVNRELVALQASGLSKRTLMRPLLCVGLLFVAFSYTNNQWIMPKAYDAMKSIQRQYQIQRDKHKKQPRAHHFVLRDNSTIIYHTYDESTHRLYDVYWVLSVDRVWHMNRLDLDPKSPIGYETQLLEREEGHLVLNGEWPVRTFEEMHFNKRKLYETLSPPEELSMTQLWNKMGAANARASEKDSELVTAFYRKMLMPWLSLLALLGPAPFCMRYSRTFSIFFVFAASLFALVAFFLIVDASSVLGKRQLIAPLIAVGAPFFFAWSFVGFKIARAH